MGQKQMKAMALKKLCSIKENGSPLELVDLPRPVPSEGEILIKISTCGVCHTELDEIEGRTPPPAFPVILGHQVVGHVVDCGKNGNTYRLDDRVGVGWIFSACGKCRVCLSGNENLCSQFKATGRDANGGYAEYMVIREEFAYPIPACYSNSEAAPLLCAGAIGYRSVRLSGIRDGDNLGLTGFGASAHLVLKMIKHLYPNTQVFTFARNENEQNFSKEIGAVWAGGISEIPPEQMDCIIDTTPAWLPVIESLKNLHPGGRLIINAIGKEETDKSVFEQLDYQKHLWLEKEVKSVANVTRRDVGEFLDLAAKIGIRPEFQEFPLESANRALVELKTKKIRGAKVLKIC